MVESNIANTAQHDYWNTVGGPRWVGLEGFVERRVRAVNDLLLARSAVAAGERLLEVGCGTGAFTVPLAEAVGEREPDLNAIAAPVFDAEGKLAGIVGVQGPASRFDRDAMRAAVGPLLAAAQAVSAGLGWSTE